MSGEGEPTGLAIHATAVAIGRLGLLIFGRSGSGKSRLAAGLVAASSARRRILLVGDDRVLVIKRSDEGMEVRPHPRVAGFIERRGLGLVATAWRERVVVAGIALLGEDVAPSEFEQQNLPVHRLVNNDEAHRVERVLTWWSCLVNRAARSRSVDNSERSGD